MDINNNDMLNLYFNNNDMLNLDGQPVYYM